VPQTRELLVLLAGRGDGLGRAVSQMMRLLERYGMADFTEAVGGAPVEDAPPLPEGERLDGLAELLGLVGFELMPAGRLLAAHRWVEGFGDADVALEVLVVSVAHAARLHATGTARLEVGAMLAVVDAIGAALGPLVAEDALGAPQLAESLETMRVFVTGGAGDVDPAVLAAGVIAAALAGWLAIGILLRYLRTHSTGIFIAYRLIAAAVFMVLLLASGTA